MKDFKILQIMPVPEGLIGFWGGESDMCCKLICLALVEHPDGRREVVGIDSQGDFFYSNYESRSKMGGIDRTLDWVIAGLPPNGQATYEEFERLNNQQEDFQL